MHRQTRLKVTDLNPHFTCVLCDGYFVDATTIVECLHSFCRACIVKYLETSRFCPVCDVQVHKTKPLLSIRADKTLQDVVYKLVPDLYQNEMKRRREFYAEHPDAAARCTSEERGEAINQRCIYAPDEKISLSLEYYKGEDDDDTNTNTEDEMPETVPKEPQRRYLECPAALTVGHLKKFVRGKFSIPSKYMVEITYADDILEDHNTLLDIAYFYEWKRSGPMKFFYFITKRSTKKLKTFHSCQDAKETASSQQSSEVPSVTESPSLNLPVASSESQELKLVLKRGTECISSECLSPPSKKLASANEEEKLLSSTNASESSTSEISSVTRTSYEPSEKSLDHTVSASPPKQIKEQIAERIPHTVSEGMLTTSIVAHTVNSTAVSALNHNKPISLPVYSTVCVKTLVPCSAVTSVGTANTMTSKRTGKASRTKNRSRPRLARLAPHPAPFKGKPTAPTVTCFAAPAVTCFASTPVTCLSTMPMRCLAPASCLGISPGAGSTSLTSTSVNSTSNMTNPITLVSQSSPSVTIMTPQSTATNVTISHCPVVSVSNSQLHSVTSTVSSSATNVSSLPATSLSPLLATALSPPVCQATHLSVNTNLSLDTPLMPAVGTAPKAVSASSPAADKMQQPMNNKNIFNETNAAALPAVSIAALPTETTHVESESRNISGKESATINEAHSLSCLSLPTKSSPVVSSDATATTSDAIITSSAVSCTIPILSDSSSNMNKSVPSTMSSQNCNQPITGDLVCGMSTDHTDQKHSTSDHLLNNISPPLTECKNDSALKNKDDENHFTENSVKALSTIPVSVMSIEKKGLNVPFKTVKSSITAEFSDTDDLGCQPDLVVDERKIDSSDNEEDGDDALRRKITAIAEKDDEADDIDSGRASDISNQARSSGDDDLGSPISSALTPDSTITSQPNLVQTSNSLSVTTVSRPEENNSNHRFQKSNGDQTLDLIISNLHRQHEKKDNIGALDLSTSSRKPGQEPSPRPRQRPVANPPVLDAKHRQQTCLPAPTKQHTACVPTPKHPTSSLHIGAISAARHGMILSPISHHSRLSPMLNSHFTSTPSPLINAHSVRCPNMLNSHQMKPHSLPSPEHGKSSPLLNSVHNKMCMSPTSHHCPASNSHTNSKSTPVYRSHHRKSQPANSHDCTSTTVSSSVRHSGVSPSVSVASPHHRLSPVVTSPKVSSPSPSVTPHLNVMSSVSSTSNYKVVQPSFPIYKKSDSYKNSHHRFKGSNLTVINPNPNGYSQKIVIKNLDPKPNNHHHHHHQKV